MENTERLFPAPNTIEWKILKGLFRMHEDDSILDLETWQTALNDKKKKKEKRVPYQHQKNSINIRGVRLLNVLPVIMRIVLGRSSNTYGGKKMEESLYNDVSNRPVCYR